MKLTLRASILAQLVVLPLLVQAAAAQNIDYRGNALHLPQGWTPDTRNRWHFISQGTALVPYEWFLALEQPGGGALLSSPANMQRLGFLIELADRDYNPDALPVGFDKVRTPVWPERILGKIDAVKVLRGRQVYAMHCADCHRLIDRTTHAAPGDGRKSCSEIQIPMYDLNTVGTDPQQATTFEQRMISLAKLGVPQEIVSYKVVETVTGKIVTQWVGASPTNAALVDEIDCGRRGEFRAPLAYRARPLNGIWAMAPYLHNGSVPSLDALLLSAKDRPKKFYVGSWEFNPEIVGYETENDFPGDFTFDTTTLGNSNAGHEYGTDLDGEDRKALIEYLKTL